MRLRACSWWCLGLWGRRCTIDFAEDVGPTVDGMPAMGGETEAGMEGAWEQAQDHNGRPGAGMAGGWSRPGHWSHRRGVHDIVNRGGRRTGLLAR